MRKDKNQLVQEALLRRATGYEATETVEEFSESNGELKLVKRRVSTKNVPADVAAANAVGMDCILYDTTGEKQKEGIKPNYIAKNYKEILDILEKMAVDN